MASYFDEIASKPAEDVPTTVSSTTTVSTTTASTTTTTDCDNKKNYLVVDPGVPGQEWCVLSFVTPEDLAHKRQLYFMDNFLHDVINEYIESSTRDMCRRINAKFFRETEDKIDVLKRSKNPNHQVISEELHKIRKALETDEEEFATLCTHKHSMELDDVLAKYNDFLVKRNDLHEKFDEMHGKRTSVMGVKFSGAYPFQDQAVERAKFLAENVERGVHHYVGQSFHWLPFDPNPDGIKDNRYLNEELNNLMKSKRENEELGKRAFEERRREMLKQENDKNANLKQRIKDKYKKIGKKTETTTTGSEDKCSSAGSCTAASSCAASDSCRDDKCCDEGKCCDVGEAGECGSECDDNTRC